MQQTTKENTPLTFHALREIVAKRSKTNSLKVSNKEVMLS